jgi:methylase of polypeptide subunit release factors
MSLTEKSFLVEVPELNRKFTVCEGVMSPVQTSTTLFLNLIDDLSTKLKDKNVLDLGCGCGVVGIAAARHGAKVVSVDILENAIASTKLNVEQESNEVQKRISFCRSDLYNNLKTLILEEEVAFDFIFFNNPIMEGEPVKGTAVDSFAGKNFEVNHRALDGFKTFLKPSGVAYTLALTTNFPMAKLWTVEHVKKALPVNFVCDLALSSVKLDDGIELSICLCKAQENKT